MTPPPDDEVPRSIRAAYGAGRFRTEARAAIDAVARHLERAHGRDDAPVLAWREPDDAARAWPADYGEVGHGDLARELGAALDASIRIHHPRFLGHQVPPPLPGAALAELVAAILNNGMAVLEMGPAAVPIERAVTGWMAQALGMPAGAGGVMTSGGSLGNLTALLAARSARAGHDAWTASSSGAPPLAILTSAEAHYSVARAVRIMGWGDAGAIAVAVDGARRMDPRALDAAAQRAADAGTRVVAIVAAAGSTGVGAFDPLDEIAAIARARGLWLHVDGAHGASLALSRAHRGLIAGIEDADSVVWDAHKLLMMPALVTAVLFRDRRLAAGAFAQDAAYLFAADAGADEWWNPGLATLECTKRMMALELHATLRAYGVGLFRDVVDRLVGLGHAFAARIAAAPDFELAVQPAANIVCFRHRPSGVGGAALDAHNAALRDRVLRAGRFYIVMTRIDGAVWLRTAIMNPLTEPGDLDQLLDHLRGLC